MKRCPVRLTSYVSRRLLPRWSSHLCMWLTIDSKIQTSPRAYRRLPAALPARSTARSLNSVLPTGASQVHRGPPAVPRQHRPAPIPLLKAGSHACAVARGIDLFDRVRPHHRLRPNHLPENRVPDRRWAEPQVLCALKKLLDGFGKGWAWRGPSTRGSGYQKWKNTMRAAQIQQSALPAWDINMCDATWQL